MTNANNIEIAITDDEVDVEFYAALTDAELHKEDADINIYADETERR